MREQELLIPQAAWMFLKTAVIYVRAVFWRRGVRLRARPTILPMKKSRKALRFAHERGKGLYHSQYPGAQRRSGGVEQYHLEELKEIRRGSLIISDPAYLRSQSAYFRNMELHVSTRQTTPTTEPTLFWHQLGAKRVVSAREFP